MPGETGTKISKREKISPQAIQKIYDAAKQGVAAEIDRIVATAMKSQAPKAEKRPHPGRPGYETIHEWEEALAPEDEPIFEIATLFVTPDVQIASLATRRKAGLATTIKESKKANAETNPIGFSIGLFEEKRISWMRSGTPGRNLSLGLICSTSMRS